MISKYRPSSKTRTRVSLLLPGLSTASYPQDCRIFVRTVEFSSQSRLIVRGLLRSCRFLNLEGGAATPTLDPSERTESANFWKSTGLMVKLSAPNSGHAWRSLVLREAIMMIAGIFRVRGFPLGSRSRGRTPRGSVAE